jgi:hypothetical protein
VKQNLVYYTIFNNRQYIKVLNLSIDTLLKTGYTGDILIITNLALHGLTKIKNNVYIFNDKQDISSEENYLNGRYKIWKYKDINKYDKIVYCDCDIFWLKSPDNIFKLINNKEISLSYEPNAILCSRFFVNELKPFAQTNLPEMNIGVFGFDSKIIDHFKDIDKFFNEHKDFWDSDQCLLNTYLYAKKIYNTNFNKKIGYLNSFENTLDIDKNVLVHFFGEEHKNILVLFNDLYKKLLT